jgi:hypothetical protein
MLALVHPADQAVQELELERLRECLAAMADGELLRFGWVAKYACSHQGKPEDGQPSILQRYEAPEERNRRKRRLPLRGVF